MRLRPVILVTAALVAASAGTLVVSCTGDDGYQYPDASVDATVPPRDVVVPVDAQPRDTGADARDAGDAGDAGDATTVDAADAADTSVITPDASVILAHAKNEIEALCILTRGCCMAAGQAQFDLAKCRAAYEGFGFQGDLITVADPVLRGGKVTVDTGRGAQCYSAIRNLGCRNITSTAYSSAATACFQTLRGTLGANESCRATLECQDGFFCEPFADGGVFPSDSGADAGDASVAPIIGRCIALKAVNAACASDFECGYRGNGNGCDPTTNRCVGPLANGADCRFSGQCSSKVCIGNCAPQITELITLAECDGFR